MKILAEIDNNNEFLCKVVFSDECTFYVSGVVNRHNYWRIRKSNAVRNIEQEALKSCWCRLRMQGMIGPFFFIQKTINGNIYLNMLENSVSPQIPKGYFFQQDGAPDMRRHLNGVFGGRWIGRGGLIPRSNTLDFFLWGYIKHAVYRTPVADLVDLHRRIMGACQTITPDMLNNTWQKIEYCQVIWVHMCRFIDYHKNLMSSFVFCNKRHFNKSFHYRVI